MYRYILFPYSEMLHYKCPICWESFYSILIHEEQTCLNLSLFFPNFRMSNGSTSYLVFKICLHFHDFVGLVETKWLQLSFASSTFTLQQNKYGAYSRVVSATGTWCTGMSILNLSFCHICHHFHTNWMIKDIWWCIAMNIMSTCSFKHVLKCILWTDIVNDSWWQLMTS